MTLHARCPLLVLSVAIAASASVQASDDDLQALELEAEPAVERPAATSTTTKAFAEVGLGWADQRYGEGSSTIGRAAIDGRYTPRLATSTRAALSARLDWTDPPDPRIDGAVFSLREAYLGWQDDGAVNLIELGRVTLRHSPGFSYNPTDFFRDYSLRTYTTVDPATLRENRMGSVMLRGEHLWSSGSVAAVFAPKLADAPSTSSFSADLGATNARNRGQFSLAYRPGERINAELLAYREEGSDVRWGASFSALVSDATVVRAEGTHSREPSLASRAAVANGPAQSGQRLNLGLTYTTSTRLSLTAEYQYNRFALDRSGWEALRLAGPDAVIGYYGQALALQDNAARDALFLQAVQEDFALKKLDLTALLRLNLTDDSRLIWLNLRYKLERFDVALRVQSNSGETGSEFGSATIRNSALVLVTAYF